MIALVQAAAATGPRWHPSPDRQAGQGIVEYGIILSGIAMVTAIALIFFGDQLAHALELITTLVENSS